jgi:hypothetical protein
MAKAIGELRSATICFAYSNSSRDIGSRLRTLRTTAKALPISSLIGRGVRSCSCFTNMEAMTANTNTSSNASTVRKPNEATLISPVLCSVAEPSKTPQNATSNNWTCSPQSRNFSHRRSGAGCSVAERLGCLGLLVAADAPDPSPSTALTRPERDGNQACVGMIHPGPPCRFRRGPAHRLRTAHVRIDSVVDEGGAGRKAACCPRPEL